MFGEAELPDVGPSVFEQRARLERVGRQAAEGNVTMQKELGKAYYNGSLDLPRDETMALFWYRSAAEAGDVDGGVPTERDRGWRGGREDGGRVWSFACIAPWCSSSPPPRPPLFSQD